MGFLYIVLSSLHKCSTEKFKSPGQDETTDVKTQFKKKKPESLKTKVQEVIANSFLIVSKSHFGNGHTIPSNHLLKDRKKLSEWTMWRKEIGESSQETGIAVY